MHEWPVRCRCDAPSDRTVRVPSGPNTLLHLRKGFHAACRLNVAAGLFVMASMVKTKAFLPRTKFTVFGGVFWQGIFVWEQSFMIDAANVNVEPKLTA